MKLDKLTSYCIIIYHYFIVYIFYLPFVKKAHGRFRIISPILFTPRFCILGRNVFIRNNARLEGVSSYGERSFNPEIIIGDNVSIEQNLHLTCANKITIGNSTAIAANVTISDIIHPYENINLPPEKQDILYKEVQIGENCKIYNNSVILPGVQLGKHNIVGANSVVVAGQYPDFCVIAGAPAKVVKKFCEIRNEWLKPDDD